ncbi:MAG: deoxyribonuclease IV [Candidatus Babeliales bacterium]
MRRKVGLHVRIHDTLLDVSHRAVELGVDFFQCFLINERTRRYVSPTNEEQQAFLKVRRKHYGHLFIHGSYWINFAYPQRLVHHAFFKELDYAKRFEFTHIVLHPGHAKGAANKVEGIEHLARILDSIVRHEQTITLVLENTSHDGLSIGSDLNDFKLLREKMDYADRIMFCIDTAHMHAFGYQITTGDQIKDALDLIDDTVGITNVALIHLNDTLQECGSRIDEHGIIGKGVIGEHNLRLFAMHERLRTIPLLMEMPHLLVEEEKKILEKVRGWTDD